MDDQQPPDEPTAPADEPTAPSPADDAPPPPPPVPPAQPPAQWAQPMAQQAPTPTTGSNGMAVASLVLGILGVVLFWAFGIGLLLGILAVIFGIVGINHANRGAPNKGLAVGGLVLGIVSVALGLLVLAAVIEIGRNADDVFDDIGSQIEYCIDNPNDPDC